MPERRAIVSGLSQVPSSLCGFIITNHAVEVHYWCDGCDKTLHKTYELGWQEGGKIYPRWGYYSKPEGEVSSFVRAYRRIEKVCKEMWAEYDLHYHNCEHWAVQLP